MSEFTRLDPMAETDWSLDGSEPDPFDVYLASLCLWRADEHEDESKGDAL